MAPTERTSDHGQAVSTQPRRSVVAFWIVATMMFISVASSAIPSPIYPVYAAEWHLSPLMLTGVFAIYVAGLLVSLLTAGALSDHVGRKPVLAVGALGVVAAMVLFVLANGVAMLIVARIVQGVFVGVLIGALGAALLDHSLERHRALAGVLNGAVPPIALAIGALSSGMLVEWAPLPEQLVYIVFGALLVLAAATLVVVPERVRKQPGALRSLRPTLGIPASSKRLFRSVVGALVSSWALGGMFLSIVPSLLPAVFGVTDHVAAGGFIAAFAGTGALTGVVIQRMDARHAVVLGLVALVVGPVVTLGFVVAHLLVGVVVGAVIAGVGFGAGFQAGLRMLLATASPAHRAGLLSAIYVASYLAFGAPSVVAGVFEPSVGIVPVSVAYGGFVVLAAVVALVAQLRSPRTAALEQAAADEVERIATGTIRTV
ncbi:MFS transporter [Curtobacterium sp. MCBD17_034]|uniref:MFS transporter n=1 Tax=unclassified Curtobacterium TaxID=257496 RepID=UPI000DA99A63|nr:MULTISPECIES: MFS transporter [unclassified Curtobacterium]PZF60393.1 MFS transporter [Curtobacterium sp. MCBD17_034]PZM35079.1 MFS transporter [Curtobacterium sp. MCBD17_031]